MITGNGFVSASRVDPQIEKLLVVQHRDVECLKIRQNLAAVPEEQRAAKAAIESKKAAIETARQELLSKDLARKEMDIEVKAREAALLRFRTQQSEVKKNEEYKALSHEIEQTEAAISDLEEREIELMLEIDNVREAFEAQEAKIKQQIEAHTKEIELLVEREKNLKTALAEAEKKVAQSREGIDSLYLEHYDRVSKSVKRAPYVTKIEAQKCSGCHLKVSNEVARMALNIGEPHFCDQCARMVYA